MTNEVVEQTGGMFAAFYNYGSTTINTVGDFTIRNTIGDSYQLYMHTDQFIGKTLYQRAKNSQSQVGIGHMGPNWAWFLPKAVMVTDRQAFTQITNYGEPAKAPVQQLENDSDEFLISSQVVNHDENKIPGDPGARISFNFLKNLLGQEVSNNLQGPAAMAARAELKPFVHSKKSFSEVHDYSKEAFKTFLSSIKKHPEEAFTHSVYELVAEILGHCVFGVTSKLDKTNIPELMQIANLITSPWKSKSQIRAARIRLEEISAELLVDGSSAIDPDKFIAVHAAITEDMPEEEKIKRLTDQNISGSYLAAINPYNLIVKTMVAISKDPALQSALLEELTDPETEKLADLRKAPLLDAVYCEALRLFSPSLVVRNTSRFFKLTTVDDSGETHETIVPPYSFMFVPIRAQHMDETIWENPGQFNPQRFIDDEKLEKLLNTFSIGTRACPAQYGFTEILFKQLIREFVLNIETLKLDKEVEEIPVHSINTSWKQTYYAKYTFRNREEKNSNGKQSAEEETSENSCRM